MTLRLTVQRGAWEDHVQAVAVSVDGLIPVVKGNGYGFGRAALHAVAADLSDYVCVGTIHELDDVPPRVEPVVLTPTLVPPQSKTAVLTVGALADVAALAGWRGRVIVKLQSSMRRYGATPAEVHAITGAAVAAGLEVIGYALHLPLAGSDDDRLGEVDAWLDRLDTEQPVWLSHLQPHSFAALQQHRRDRRLRLRLGTTLWHGDKSFLHLHAEVLSVHSIRSGERAGYRLTPVDSDGHLVLVSAGTAHGVVARADGTGPFHFASTRLTLLEPPHMHTSMVFAPAGTPCPAPGDSVDVQRPLTSTLVDEVEWV
jgi:alanine racemase